MERELKAGLYNKGLEEREPPFMAPSANPEDYSNVCTFPTPNVLDTNGFQWCSMCCNLGSYMIMCAGCRVAVCSGGPTHAPGCLEWEPQIESPKFIYYCPFCINARDLRPQVCESLFAAGA